MKRRPRKFRVVLDAYDHVEVIRQPVRFLEGLKQFVPVVDSRHVVDVVLQRRLHHRRGPDEGAVDDADAEGGVGVAVV